MLKNETNIPSPSNPFIMKPMIPIITAHIKGQTVFLSIINGEISIFFFAKI